MNQFNAFHTITFRTELKAGEEVNIFPIGDLHLGTDSFAKAAWRRTMNIIKEQPKAYIIGTGDYIDCNSTSERKLMSEMHDTTLERYFKEQKGIADSLVNDIQKTNARVIGMVEGNHFAHLSNSETTTEYMCKKLGGSYLGAYGIILFTMFRDLKVSRSYTFGVHHGCSTGDSLSGTALEFARWAQSLNADFYLAGHNHQDFTASDCFLDTKIRDGKICLVTKRHRFIRTSTFQKAYKNNTPSFEAKRKFKPKPISLHQIQFKRRRSNGKDLIEIIKMEHELDNYVE